MGSKPIPNYFCISIADGQSGTNRIRLVRTGSPGTPQLYYSTDRKTWTLWSDITQYISLDNPVYFRGENTSTRYNIKMGRFNGGSNYSVNNYVRFSAENSTTKIKLSGDITSIIGWCDFLDDVCFTNLFYYLTAVEDASELDMSNCKYGYRRRQFAFMFQGCTSLKYPPQKLVITLTASCFQSMFNGCTALVYAPEILSRDSVSYPSPEHGAECYLMFYNCSLITRVVNLMEVKDSNSFNNWLNAVPQTSDCVFVKSANVADDFWPSGASGIPTNWTVEVEPAGGGRNRLIIKRLCSLKERRAA